MICVDEKINQLPVFGKNELHYPIEINISQNTPTEYQHGVLEFFKYRGLNHFFKTKSGSHTIHI